MSDVWVILIGESGESDCTAVCACLTREDAEILCKRMNTTIKHLYDDYRVESLPVCDGETARAEILDVLRRVGVL